MSRRALLPAALALLLALVTLAVWLQRPRAAAPAAPPGAAVAVDGEASDPLHPPERDEVAAPAPASLLPMSAESSPAPQPGPAGTRVLVVERDGGAPVPGAEVRWMSYGPE